MGVLVKPYHVRMYVLCIVYVCIFFQKTRYQAGMRNSENLTANNTFSKPTRYQVTMCFSGRVRSALH